MLQVTSQNICWFQCNGLPCLTPATQLLCSHSVHVPVHLCVFVDFPSCAIGWERRGSFFAVFVVADTHMSFGQGKRTTGSVIMWTQCQMVSSTRRYNKKTHAQDSPWSINLDASRGLELSRCPRVILSCYSHVRLTPKTLPLISATFRQGSKNEAQGISSDCHWRKRALTG